MAERHLHLVGPERKNAKVAFKALCEKYEKSLGMFTSLASLNALQGGGQFLFVITEAGGPIRCLDP
jgi:hypothetical protein